MQIAPELSNIHHGRAAESRDILQRSHGQSHVQQSDENIALTVTVASVHRQQLETYLPKITDGELVSDDSGATNLPHSRQGDHATIAVVHRQANVVFVLVGETHGS